MNRNYKIVEDDVNAFQENIEAQIHDQEMFYLIMTAVGIVLLAVNFAL